MRAGIYCIENLFNGKKYIGQGTNVEKRMWQYHRECDIVYAAIKKYGKENFKRYVILYCEPDKNVLAYYEIACIRIFCSHVSEGGYNISWGGTSPMTGRKHSAKSKKLMSKNNTRKPWTEKRKKEHSKRMSGKNHPLWGTHPSIKTRKKIAKNHFDNSGKNSPNYGKTGKDSFRFGKKSKNASSKYFGTIKHIRNSGHAFYEARIYSPFKYIGSYKNEIDAAQAYDKYIIENSLPHPLNFPLDKSDYIDYNIYYENK